MGGIGSAIAGSVASGLVSKAFGGGSRGGGVAYPKFERGFDPAWKDEYNQLRDKWARDRADELQRAQTIGAEERDKTLDILKRIYDYGIQVYDELPQEVKSRNYLTRLATSLEQVKADEYRIRQEMEEERTYKDYAKELKDVLTQVVNREGPIWDDMIERSEMDRKRAYEQNLRKFFAQNERTMARGGVGFINPERRDEMYANLMAEYEDQARDSAINDVTQNILSAVTTGGSQVAPQLQNVATMARGREQQAQENLLAQLALGSSTVAPLYGQQAQAERARQEAQLGLFTNTELQKLAASQAYETAISDILNKYKSTEPIAGQVKRQYYYQNQGVPIATGGGTPNPWAGALGDAFSQAAQGAVQSFFPVQTPYPQGVSGTNPWTGELIKSSVTGMLGGGV